MRAPDTYQWHLDDRPLHVDNEINPDVLGYIFEKYINQKQMGAYYTGEDITSYIASNTVMPRLLEKLAATSTEFSLQTVAVLLAEHPDRYVNEALRHGSALELPSEVATGLDDPAARDAWNATATPAYGVPTETWRDVVDRRRQHESLLARLAEGNLDSASDLIALNIGLRLLAEDVIHTCESPALLLDIYRTLESLSVLDPTCGSGAFLFAALNILEPLYEAALERMEAFIVDGAAGTERAEFAAITARIEAHPNRAFFVLKTIVVNNLYGVDIMEEAVEICKLRLFLRLVSQVERADDLEPLPDMDFNVRAGNALIGFGDREQFREALSSELDLTQAGERLDQRITDVDAAFASFRHLQLGTAAAGDHTIAQAKGTLRQRLTTLRSELNSYIAAQRGRDPDADSHHAWLESHMPFHWFVEFHEIMSGGGFDVIVGNPPFVEYPKVRAQYTVTGFETLSCNNLYAFVLERSLQLAGGLGRLGMISPLSLTCTTRMAPLRILLNGVDALVPAFDIRPSPLFDGVTQRLCFLFAAKAPSGRKWSAGYRRWFATERPTLLSTVHYTATDRDLRGGEPLPKFAADLEKSIRAKLGRGSLGLLTDRAAEPIYVHRIVRYFIKSLDFVPLFIDANGQLGRSDDYKEYRFKPSVKPFVVALLNSSLFYWYWRVHGDGFHCGKADIFLFPHERIQGAPMTQFEQVSARLMDAMRTNSTEKTISTKRGLIRYQEFRGKPLKPLLDEIDLALAAHFGLTAEEHDYVINYDVKYRIGADDESEG